MARTSRLLIFDVSDASAVVVCGLCGWRSVARTERAAAVAAGDHITEAHRHDATPRQRDSARQVLARRLH